MYITERLDDIIIINSHKIYPSDIEKEIYNNTCINECLVLLYKKNQHEKIICMYSGEIIKRIDILPKLRKNLLPYEIPSIFLHVNKIPKNGNGKVMKKDVYTLIDNYISKKGDIVWKK